MADRVPCGKILHESVVGFEDEFRINYKVKAWLCGEGEDEGSKARVALCTRCQQALEIIW